jgi:hypothetical protein
MNPAHIFGDFFFLSPLRLPLAFPSDYALMLKEDNEFGIVCVAHVREASSSSQ